MMEIIAELIKQERMKQELSYEEIAKRVGVTSRSIRLWEKQERSISLENADKIMKALNVSIVVGKSEQNL